MTDVEIVARAMIAPLGHNPAADWSRVFVGNGAEADGSLRALCYELAVAALAAATPLIGARVREECAQVADGFDAPHLDGVGQLRRNQERTTMSEPISDAELARIKQYGVSFGLKLYRQPTIADLITRLAAAEAERDAAVARAEALADSYSKPFAAQVAEGERRATAAIVADLREFAASDRAKHFADRYEAGDHLKGSPQ